MSKHGHDVASGNDGSQLGSVWSQLTSGNVNALDLMKEASGYLKTASQDYHSMSVLDKDIKHVNHDLKYDHKQMGRLGERYGDDMGNAREDIHDMQHYAAKAQDKRNHGHFGHAADADGKASQEGKEAAGFLDDAIKVRGKQADLTQDITDDRQRRTNDKDAINILGKDAKHDSKYASAEMSISNIFHQLGLG